MALDNLMAAVGLNETNDQTNGQTNNQANGASIYDLVVVGSGFAVSSSHDQSSLD